jgi:hypothetical protein
MALRTPMTRKICGIVKPAPSRTPTMTASPAALTALIGPATLNAA